MVDSYELTPFRSDFIDNVKCDFLVKDATKVNRVIGIGTNINKFIDSNGQDIFLLCIFYLPTQKYVCLLYYQTYHQMHGIHYVVQGKQITIQFQNHRIRIPIDLVGNNLPVVHNSFVTDNQKRAIGNYMRYSFTYLRLSNLGVFGDINSIQYLQAMDISSD